MYMSMQGFYNSTLWNEEFHVNPWVFPVMLFGILQLIPIHDFYAIMYFTFNESSDPNPTSPLHFCHKNLVY